MLPAASSTLPLPRSPGEYYPIDLLEPPFNVSKPLEVIDEHTEDGKHLLLFEVAKMTWSDPLPGLLRRRLR